MLPGPFAMERDRGMNLKLWVPPRVSNGQMSTVGPQLESCGDFMNPLQQVPGYSKCFDKGKNKPFPTSSMVTPSKSVSQGLPKLKVVPPMENYENNCNPGQLCSKLFDEVEKIKCWKAKVESDTVQKERRLQENKRTIETQRKAIQELQFGTESLSTKLEEQIGENEDLRNKNNITRNLCNILKDTFDRTTEKMKLFESEREDTHHLFKENSQKIKKLTGAFESLSVQVQSDQEEMQRGLLQLDEIKGKYFQEYKMKEEEVAELQLKLQNKDNELQKILRDLHETQKRCSQLEETTNEQYKVLESSKAEQKSLLQKLQASEQSCEEAQKNHNATAAALKKREEEYAQTIQSKDLSLKMLSRVNKQQAEKLDQSQITTKELQNLLSIQMQSTKELEDKLITNNEELERKDTLLRETMEQCAKKDGHIKILEDELDMKLKSIESMKVTVSGKAEEVKVLKSEVEMMLAENELLKKAGEVTEEMSAITETKVQELQGQLFTEIKKNEECSFEMEQLRRDIAFHKVKYEGLLSNFNELQSEKTAIQQQLERGASHVKAIEADIKVSEEKLERLARENQSLKEENQHFREEISCIKTEVQGKCQETQTLQKKIDKNCQQLQGKLIGKEKQIKILETKMVNLKKKIEMKLEVQEKSQKEIKELKKQLENEKAKSVQLRNMINSLHDESRNIEQVSREVHQKLLKDMEHKTALAAELENEIQKLRLSSAEAIKNKDDAELKCQHKIADMVALMEKHKSQYDRMVGEKDAELDETKKKEVDAVTQKKSLELDLTKRKIENDELKKQLKTETTKKENLQKELTDLKKEMSSMKITELAEAENKPSGASKRGQRRFSDTPKESASKSNVFDRSTPSYFKDKGSAAAMKNAEPDTASFRTSCGTTPKTKDIHTEEVKTPSMTNTAERPSKIKSYRVRTPPYPEKAAGWGKGSIEFDPKSDSSDQSGVLTFVATPTPNVSVPHCNRSIFKKSPASHKSPGNTLKHAAMKRMRDAGWTAVTGCDKKKNKMKDDMIFA